MRNHQFFLYKHDQEKEWIDVLKIVQERIYCAGI